MGVTGLWQILQPCARPIKIETLNRKRLAVDASIWIYQFLKAVRDKEGNALRNSHVVGFFRRVCKLLFIGIKPVFVFDGGAPALKRQTIRARKSRREGRREDAAQTAAKILAKQMQHAAEEEEARRKAEKERPAGTAQVEEEAVPDDGLVYVDELQMTQQERQQNRKFRKKDAYHLPELDVSMNEMGGPNDLRVMSLEDLQAYARQFDTGEDINVYDFSKIDYDSPFFMSLPPADRYNILNAARLRSRLRMGYSKDQLDTMFPDRMAFSKFQIDRVRERNELTQRLMNLEGYDTMEFGGRIAGEKSREYVLVKNDGVEGGWALGVISDEGREEKPIDLDKPDPTRKDDEEWEDEEDFEDVPIEGLNRLPKSKSKNHQAVDELTKQRRALYTSRKNKPRRKPKRTPAVERSELFVQSSSEDEAEEAAAWEEIDPTAELFGEEQEGSEDEDLRRAIAMSMENDHTTKLASEAEEDDMLDVFQQSAVEEAKPLPKGSGRSIANIVNKRAFNAAPESREITSFGVPTQKPDDGSDEDDSMDFQAALAESRKGRRKISPPRKPQPPPPKEQSASDIAKKAGFSGPLPFEKLDLGSSLLGKKKMQQRTEEAAGGFVNPEVAEREKNTTKPLPPWFSGDVEKDLQAQNDMERQDRQRAKEFDKQFQFQDRGISALRRQDTNEVIDLEAENGGSQHFRDGEIIDIDRDEDQDPQHANAETKSRDMANELRAAASSPKNTELYETVSPAARTSPATSSQEAMKPAHKNPFDQEDSDEMIEWSESDREDVVKPVPISAKIHQATEETHDESVSHDHRSPSLQFENVGAPVSASQSSKRAETRSPSAEPEFEDVGIPDALSEESMPAIDKSDGPSAIQNSGIVAQDTIPEDDEFDDFSDPEEAEMLRNLTIEAEEHARFASTLNNKTQAENVADYERELKQLRNQQKKDRRDADEVTQTMIQECQALLRLFGLPYVTAPMEAEAQCAELVHLGLVDGIVTDDSDCFLFGGTRVYKNMFNQAKFVECYLTSDLEKEFDLTRDKLIAIAQLLGSDYTEGLHGVGAVTALEIISEFPRLEDFKTWWSGVQTNQISKSEDSNKPFRKKFRKNASKLFLPPAFPDARVEMAYKTPEVDSDPEQFQWGVPDLNALRSFLMATIGWSQERTDEVLVPVIKDMNRRLDEGTQANITAFFDGGVGVGAAGVNSRGDSFAPRKRVDPSKRMGNALSRMAERAKNRRGESSAAAADGEGDNAQGAGATATDGESSTTAEGSRKAPKRRKGQQAQGMQAEVAAASDDEGSEFDGPRKKRTKRRAKATTARKSNNHKTTRQVNHDG